jgi:uncharacterized membrane protein YhaH (DUF805 family)
MIMEKLPEKVGLTGAFRNFFHYYATFSGRSSRSEYWFLWATGLVLYLLLSALTFAFDLFELSMIWIGLLAILLGLGLAVPSLALMSRRLRDAGISTYFLFFLLLPIVGGLVLFVMMMSPSKDPATAEPSDMHTLAKTHKMGNIIIFSTLLALVAVVVKAGIDTADYNSTLFGFDYFFLANLVVLFIPALLLSFLIALIASAIGNRAEKSGRSWYAFFWLSALVSPIIMGIIAASLKPLGQSDAPLESTAIREEPSLEAKLSELQSLRDKGVLSDEEFAEARKKVLGI